MTNLCATGSRTPDIFFVEKEGDSDGLGLKEHKATTLVVLFLIGRHSRSVAMFPLHESCLESQVLVR